MDQLAGFCVRERAGSFFCQSFLDIFKKIPGNNGRMVPVGQNPVRSVPHKSGFAVCPVPTDNSSVKGVLENILHSSGFKRISQSGTDSLGIQFSGNFKRI